MRISFNIHYVGPTNMKHIYVNSCFGILGWRGPSTLDMQSKVALEVLLRYLTEDAASPLHQAFVETAEPWASDVMVDYKQFSVGGIFIIFLGVPRLHDAKSQSNRNDHFDNNSSSEANASCEDEDEHEDEDEDGSSEEEENDDDDDDGVEMDEQNPLEGNNFYNKLRTTLLSLLEKEFTLPNCMEKTIRRHRYKILEDIEADSNEFFSTALIPDILFNTFSRYACDKNDKSSNDEHILATAGLFQVLKDLESKGSKFWSELLEVWLLNSSPIEVKMIPSRKLADDLEVKKFKDEQARREVLGPSGLYDLQRTLDLAIQNNIINITPDLISTMPSVPGWDQIGRLDWNTAIMKFPTTSKISKLSQFSDAIIIHVPTTFLSIRLNFSTSSLPENLRPYLVLLQHLLFQSPLLVPQDSKSINKSSNHLTSSKRKRPQPLPTTSMGYREVVAKTSNLLTSYDVGLGYGGATWSSGWLSNVFGIYGVVPAAYFTDMIEWLIRVFLFTKFEKSRIRNVAKNLLSDLVELKRDADALLTVVMKKTSGGVGELNDEAISIFRQERFLRDILKDLKKGKREEHEIISKLNALRDHLLFDLSLRNNSIRQTAHSRLNFVQITAPNDQEKSILQEFDVEWNKG